MESAKSLYEGERLRRAKQAERQLLLIFQSFWKKWQPHGRIYPSRERCPYWGDLFSEGMEKEGLLLVPQMEPLVVAHLHPKCSVAANATLPSRVDWFQSSMTDRAYMSVALSVRALNAISLLTAYQAELQDELSATPGQAQWDKICVVTDLSLRLQRCAVQAAAKLWPPWSFRSGIVGFTWLNFSTGR